MELQNEEQETIKEQLVEVGIIKREELKFDRACVLTERKIFVDKREKVTKDKSGKRFRAD